MAKKNRPDPVDVPEDDEVHVVEPPVVVAPPPPEVPTHRCGGCTVLIAQTDAAAAGWEFAHFTNQGNPFEGWWCDACSGAQKRAGLR